MTKKINIDIEKLSSIICQSSSDYDVLDEVYNYIIYLEKEKSKLEINYEKAINFLVNTGLLPCENFDNFDEKYCEKKCSNGDRKCWEHYIEKRYKIEKE